MAETSSELIFKLPFPPSLNSLYPGKVRRHKSAKYEAWIIEARQAIYCLSVLCCSNPVSVAYRFGRPDNRKRDLDNLFKAPNDFLVSHLLINDDSLIHKISGEWADDVQPGLVEVIISPY